jgi:hypothetical protein
MKALINTFIFSETGKPIRDSNRKSTLTSLLPCASAPSRLCVLLLALSLFSSFNLWAQGSGMVNFANLNATPDRRIYWCFGQTLLSGSGYRIALYWGPQGTPESGLVQVGASVGFLTGAAAGTFTGGIRTLMPLTANGAIVTLQARAWQTIPGIPDSYEGVLASGGGGVGKGPVFDHKSKDPNNPLELAVAIGGPVANGGNPNWQGFSTIGGIGCPEPSTITLAVLGGAALLLVCRRKKTL